MLYSNNLTTFALSIIKDGSLMMGEDDDVIHGAPEGSEFHVKGMGGVLICSDGTIHPKQERLAGVIG